MKQQMTLEQTITKLSELMDDLQVVFDALEALELEQAADKVQVPPAQSEAAYRALQGLDDDLIVNALLNIIDSQRRELEALRACRD